MAILSRRTVKILADLYVTTFMLSAQKRSRFRPPTIYIDNNALYTFVYERDCEAWLCSSLQAKTNESALRMFILKLHTGESVNSTWSAQVRADYGQRRLLELCTAILLADETLADAKDLAPLRGALELDGYVFRNGKLLSSEGEQHDVEAERGELMQLYVDLALPNADIVRDCLDKSEEHYGSGSFRDCIGNARHYLEQVLEDVARAWSETPGAPALTIGPTQPAAGPCRNYLEQVGVLTADERAAFKELHGLLSATGGHPALSEREQARVFRRLATSMALYVMLRYQAAR